MPHLITERQAMRWVQKYISAFGGDPTKVTMYACFSSPKSKANSITSAGAKVLAQFLSGSTWSPTGGIPRDFSVVHSCKVDRQSQSVTSPMVKDITTFSWPKPDVPVPRTRCNACERFRTLHSWTLSTKPPISCRTK
jgi:hypothetical protein